MDDIIIPRSHLKMPPPYWRSSGIDFQIIDALLDLRKALVELDAMHPHVNANLSDYFDNQETDDLELFNEITEPLNKIEFKIKLKCELAVFMTAIQIEDLINMVIVFNINKDTSESIERLNCPQKLLLISEILTGKSIKNSQEYEIVKKITKWRNAFAHGHCTDRPTQTLRKNHLISPKHYPTVPLEIKNMLMYLNGYIKLSKYLNSISINEYTQDSSYQCQEISECIKEIERYKFYYQDKGEVYEFEYVHEDTPKPVKLKKPEN